MNYEKKRLVIEWDLTYQCNLNCLHCSAIRKRNEKGNLSIKDLTKVMKKFSSYFCILHINPSAGESTTRSDFVEIYNLFAHAINTVRMTTNGIILSKIIKKMYLKNLSLMTISIDGSEMINNITRGDNAYKKACKSLKALHEKKENENLSFNTQINYVLHRLNSDSLKEMAVLLDEYDVDVINVIKVDLDTGNAKTHADTLYLSYEDCIDSIGELLQKLKMINKSREKIGKKPILLRPELFTAKWLYLLAKTYGLKYVIFEKRHSCHVLTQNYLYLNPIGNAFPCLFFTQKRLQEEMIKYYGSVTTPNIVENTVEEILESSYFTNARNLLKEFLNFDNLPCKSCNFLNTCAICPIYAQLWGVKNDCF